MSAKCSSEADHLRVELHLLDADPRRPTDPEYVERAAMALLDQRTQRMPDNPRSVCRCTNGPPPTDLDGEIGVILGDVVEVVGDRALHVSLGVVFQELEQCDDRPRVVLEAA